MLDPLLKRAQLAIEDAQTFRKERRALLAEQREALYELRWAVHQSASAREWSKEERRKK